MAVVDVVQWSGRHAGSDVFAWKFPNSELSTFTQLIVHESQVAVLYKGGQALDTFGPGRHTLETANIPILRNLVNLPFGGRSPFIAEVWFVNKVHSLDVKWGTPSPIQLRDPEHNLPVPVRSNGQFGIQIDEPNKFLQKLVGVLPVFNQETLTKFFRGIYVNKVKDSIAQYFVKKGIGILDINAYLGEISDYVKELLIPEMNEYGIRLINFYVNEISIPEDYLLRLEERMAEGMEEATRIKRLGALDSSLERVRSFDVVEAAVSNQGNAAMNASIGLGMGAGIGNVMGTHTASFAQGINTTGKMCSKCNSPIQARFCQICGHDSSMDAPVGAETISCEGCGEKYANTIKFCPECGKPSGRSCPKCNTIVTNKKTKFCPECGESLVKKCGGCDIPIEGNPKFCPECGKGL